MADGIEPNKHDSNIARIGIYNILDIMKDFKSFNGTKDEAIDALGLRELVEHLIKVKAADIAYIRMLNNNAMHPEMIDNG